MRYDAVIFDLFGTLIDLLPQAEYDVNDSQVAEALGVPAEDYARTWIETAKARGIGEFGETLAGDIRTIANILGCSPSDDQLARAREIRLEIVRRNHQPRDGGVETLSKLKSMGLKTALVTDVCAETPEIWPETEYSSLIDLPVFSCRAGISKPDPRIYALAYEGLGVLPERCLYVGDGGSMELTGARKVGLNPVLIKVGDEPEHDEHRPDAANWDGLVITHLSQVLELAV